MSGPSNPAREAPQEGARSTSSATASTAGGTRRPPARRASARRKRCGASASRSSFAGTLFPEKRRGDRTVEGLRDRWLKHAEHKASIRDDRERFERIVAFFKPHTRVSDIDRDRVVDFRKALLVTPARRRGRVPPAEAGRAVKTLAPSTVNVNRHLALLRAALRLAEADGFVVQRAFVAGVLLEEDNARDRICSEAELEQLVGAAAAELGRVIALLYWTGCRLTEITSLVWGQVGLDRGMLALRETKNRTPRRVPVPAPALDILRAMDAARAAPRLASDRLFRKLAESSWSGAFARLTERLSILDVTPHDLRHTALTRLRRAGVDVLTMQRISGHKSLAMLARYNTVDDDDLLAAAARVVSTASRD